MAPITDTMHRKQFFWSPKADNAFNMIKQELTHAYLLVLPSFSTPFEVHCDASKIEIWVVLSQGGQSVAYFREKNSRAWSRYYTYDLEFYVVVQVIRY